MKSTRTRRAARPLTFNGRTQSMTAWAQELGLTISAMSLRISRGTMELDTALSAPKGKVWGGRNTIAAKARETGIAGAPMGPILITCIGVVEWRMAKRDDAEQHLLDENDVLLAKIVALKHALVETMAAAWPCAAQRYA